jgi:hypothetical protein
MKETEKKLDILLAKAGQIGNYQFQVTFLFLLQLTCAEFFNQCLPFLERSPFVYINDSKESVLINYTICNSTNYIIDKNKIPNSIVMDFEIYCQEKKISYLGLLLYAGMIAGACSSYSFADKIGRKKTLVIFCPIHIIFLCTFKILTPSFWNNCLYLIYLNIFLLGFFCQMIVITMIIYICEVIKQTDIPIFVMLIITGIPLSSLLGTLLFNIDNLDWRDSLLIVAGINFIIYFFIIFTLIGSPIFSLNNELFDTFIFDLIKIGKRNGVKLTLNDFDLLNPYMSRESRQTVYRRFMKEINDLNTNLIDNDQNNDVEKNLGFNVEEEYLSSKNNVIALSKNALKDDYLLSNNESNEELLKLFGKLKMKDYSPLDLIRFKKQIKNFLILSFLWLVTMLIKNGINLKTKFIPKMNEEIQWSVFNYISEIISYYIMLYLYIKMKIEFHGPLIMLQIISYIIFMFLLYTDLKSNEVMEIILLFTGRLCWSCMFALISVITAIIYPIMIRTKGFGWNKSFGFIGAIIAILLVEYLEIKQANYIFLTFEFFTLTLSYGLPNKIGTFILESPSVIHNDKEKDKEKDNNEILEVRNTLFMKEKSNKKQRSKTNDFE